MNISKDTIYKVADLARIDIKEEEVPGLIKEMSKILTFMEQLNELDTTAVEPLVYMIEQGLGNAPVRNERFFMVPKIIEK
jgi:aspartyl-tRNA(Asn)/glutamyl-tRNA(Gln) amidotransferase subunit C